MIVEQHYADLDEFYAADPRREVSPEVDFGVMWRGGDDALASYRVSWVEATGELYIYRMTGGHSHYSVTVFDGLSLSRDAVDAVLDGWAIVCPQLLSVGWLLGQLAIADALSAEAEALG